MGCWMLKPGSAKRASGVLKPEVLETCKSSCAYLVVETLNDDLVTCILYFPNLLHSSRQEGTSDQLSGSCCPRAYLGT